MNWSGLVWGSSHEMEIKNVRSAQRCPTSDPPGRKVKRGESLVKALRRELEVLQLCRSALISWPDMVLEPSVAGLFKWRQFEPEMILLAVGWYLRFSLSYRDVEELLAERGLFVDHVTIWSNVTSIAASAFAV